MAWLSRRKATEHLELRNDTDAPLEVMVEVTPDRYILPPGRRLVIEAETLGAPYSVTFYDGGLQIYAGDDGCPVIRIEGEVAEPDWSSPGPNASKR